MYIVYTVKMDCGMRVKVDEQIRKECQLSYYHTIGVLNERHEVFYVQHRENHKIYVKKNLYVYNREIYEFIRQSNSKYFPKIYECVDEQTHLTVIEEYINGKTLEELQKEKGVFSEKEAAFIICELCNALEPLHTHCPSYIHRDIKPSNIMISNEGNVKVVDLNTAKIYHENQQEDTLLLGTKAYAAPEQYGFGQSDPRTDIYALGVLLNVLLTGKLPRERKAGGRMGTIVTNCINLSPTHRYDSVTALKNVLQIKEESPKEPYTKDTQVLGRQKTYHKNRLPGFRSGNYVHMIIAVIGYGLIGLLCMGLELKNGNGIEAALEKLAVASGCLIVVAFTTNYRKMRDYFPFQKSERKEVRVIAGIIEGFLLFWAAFLFFVILLVVFGS